MTTFIHLNFAYTSILCLLVTIVSSCQITDNNENGKILLIFQNAENNFFMDETNLNSFVVLTLASKTSLNLMIEICNEIENNHILAIVDKTDLMTGDEIRHLAVSLDIPYLRIGSQRERNDSTIEKGAFSRHPITSFMLMLREIIQTTSKEHLAIIYDEMYELEDFHSESLMNILVFHAFYKMAHNSSYSNFHSILSKIDESNLVYIIIAAKSKTIKELFVRFDSARFDMKHEIIVFNKDSEVSPLCEKCKYDQGAMVIRPIMLTNIPDCSCTGEYDLVYFKCLSQLLVKITTNFESQQNISSLKGSTCSQPMQRGRVENFLEQINKTDLSTNHGKIVWKNGVLHYELALNAERWESRAANAKSAAEWRNGKMTINSLPLLEKTSKSYRVTVLHSPPFVFIERVNGTVKYSGLCIDLIRKIAELSEFEIRFQEPADKMFGNILNDGSWNGMIRELIDDEADIAVGPISIMAEREVVVDFTVTFYDTVGITILFKKPIISYRLDRFLDVFDPLVWVLILVSLIGVSILIALADYFGPMGSRLHPEKDTRLPKPRKFSIFESLWFCTISITPQGGGDLPIGLSGRIIALAWWIFGFLIVSTYTANLAAFLTVSRMEKPIESLDDLAKQFQTKYAALNGSSTQEYFERMMLIEERFYNIWKTMSLRHNMSINDKAEMAVFDYPISEKYSIIWESMENSGFPNSLEEAMHRVRNENFAFLGDASINKYAELTSCDLWSLGNEFSRKPYGFAVQKGSYLKKMLSSQLLHLTNIRYLEERTSHWWNRDVVTCNTAESSETQGINLKSIGGLFLLSAGGMVMGVIVFFFENYHYKWKKSNSAKLTIQQPIALTNGNSRRKYVTNNSSTSTLEKGNSKANLSEEISDKNDCVICDEKTQNTKPPKFMIQ